MERLKHKRNKRIVILNWIGALFIVVFIIGCKNDQINQGNNLSINQQADTVKNDYAKAFRIIYHPDDIQIDILNPESNQVIVSYSIGKEDTAIPTDFPRAIDRVVTFSSTQVGMLEKLGLENKIVGVSNYQYLCHPLDQSITKEMGDISVTNPEKVMAVHPGIIFYSGFNLNAPIIEKFRRANLKPFLIYEWKETTPLGRAEWIKVYGVLFNHQQEANAIFNSIKQRYFAVKKQLNTASKRPTVISGTYYNDVFNAPAGNSYMAQLLADANADYVYSYTRGTGSLSLPLEKVILKNQHTEYWLNPSAGSVYDLLQQNNKLQLMGAFKSKKIYSYFDRKNCFWANSAIEPDEVLKEIGAILHPEIFPGYKMKYYEQLK